MRNKRIRGFTLVETLAAITIASVMLGLAGIGISRSVQNSKLDKTEITIRACVSDLENYITERGGQDLKEDEALSNAAERFITEFNNGYASAAYDADTLSIGSNSFTIDTKSTTDAWGNKLKMYYSHTKDLFIIASAGPNMKFEFLTEPDSYNFDDILAVMVRK